MALLAILFAQMASGEETWYEAYDAGLKAAKAGNWPLAEEKLLAARKAQPKPGRNVLAYGRNFYKLYAPDLYLGICYFYEGKYEAALSQFQLVRQSGVLGRSDAEYTQMLDLEKKSNEKLHPSPTVEPSGPSQDEIRKKQIQEQTDSLVKQIRASLEQEHWEEARKDLQSLRDLDPSNSSIEELSNDLAGRESAAKTRVEQEKKKAEEENAKQQFAGLIQAANEATAKGKYGNARDLLRRASEMGGDQAQVAQGVKAVDIAEKTTALQTALKHENWAEAQRISFQLAAIDPQSTEVKNAQSLIKKGLGDLNSVELRRKALAAFYSGSYDQSIALFELVVSQDKNSAIAYFYLGCSHAALSFSQGKQGTARLQKARECFSQARKMNPHLQYDTAAISPRVLEIYSQSR